MEWEETYGKPTAFSLKSHLNVDRDRVFPSITKLQFVLLYYDYLFKVLNEEI